MGSIETNPVPIVDISAFTSPTSTPEERAKASRIFGEACSINGAVGITGHGISTATIEQAFALSKRLFTLSHEDKMKAPHPDAPLPHRGYSGLGRENGAAKFAIERSGLGKMDLEKLSKIKDTKETFEVGSELNKEQQNIWFPPEVLPGFKEEALALYQKLNDLSTVVYKALVASLNLTDEESAVAFSLHTGIENQLRLSHYPSFDVEMLKAKAETTSRLGAHTDFSLFTLLFQDKAGGLEFGDRRTGEFIPAIPHEGVAYMNIGDMFQRFSNGIYPSALHRVVIPGENSGKATPDRYSIPFFVAAAADNVIEPPQTLVNLVGKQVYEPIKAKEYMEVMYKATQVRG